ncbi:hypothetical protein AB6C80_010915 [Vibrio cyclitrophicus]
MKVARTVLRGAALGNKCRLLDRGMLAQVTGTDHGKHAFAPLLVSSNKFAISTSRNLPKYSSCDVNDSYAVRVKS